MRKSLFVFSVITYCSLSLLAWSPASADNWPAWRGERGTGFSGETNIPVEWSSTKNVLWKRPIPGRGHSSPIVWNDMIIVTYANESDLTRHVMAVTRETGETIWDKVVATGTIEKMHADNTPASATPTTDGESIYIAFYIEDHLVAMALSIDGEMQWEKTVGTFKSAHGFSTALVLDENKLFLSGLQDGPDSGIVALDKKSGDILWKQSREQKIRSFSAPCLVNIEGRKAIILSGAHQTVAYDAASGNPLWALEGPAEKTVSSIVAAEDLGLAFVSGGRDDRFFAVEYAKTDKDEIIKWEASKGIPYVNSPYYQDGLLHIVSDDGIYRSYDAATGELFANQRVAGKVSASMVGAAGLVYIVDSEGTTTVIKNAPDFQVVAINSIGEEVVASPAISNGDIVLRSTENLYLIRDEAK